MPDAVYMTGLLEAVANFTTDTYRWMLLTDAYDPDPDTEVFVADVSAFELADASYGRITVAGKTVTNFAPTRSLVAFDADDADFGSLSGSESAGWLVLYHEVTNDADSELVCALRVSRVTDGTNVTVEFVDVNPPFTGFLSVARGPGGFFD